jgi:hypothetical protein
VGSLLPLVVLGVVEPVVAEPVAVVPVVVVPAPVEVVGTKPGVVVLPEPVVAVVVTPTSLVDGLVPVVPEGVAEELDDEPLRRCSSWMVIAVQLPVRGLKESLSSLSGGHSDM